MELDQQRFGGAALITGASSGFGAAFARALAARKMDLVLVARRKEQLDALAAECAKAHGVKTLVIAQDLGAPGAAQAVKNAVDAAGVPVGLLINNAGFGSYGEFEKQDAAHEAAMVDLNCRAPVALTHAFLPDMLARGRGGLIFVASIAAYQPTPFFAVYGATKAFDLMLAEALWGELTPRGIAVLGLSPGYSDTGFQTAASSGEGPRMRPAPPEQIVETALGSLGHGPSVVNGFGNWAMVNASRFVPRSVSANVAAKVNRPPAALDSARAEREGVSKIASAPPRLTSSRFQRDVLRMLLTFFAVIAIDFGFVAAFTGIARFWFPVWLDAQWATRPQPWIVYSQSYFAGIFFIPVLAWAIAREFLSNKSVGLRAAYWLVVAGAGSFIAWWKGGLMVEFGKGREAVGWLILSATLYAVVVAAEAAARRATTLTRHDLLRKLTTGVAWFFLITAVIDPVLQLGVQKLAFSTGLGIEVGFFIPAGLLLLFASRKMTA